MPTLDFGFSLQIGLVQYTRFGIPQIGQSAAVGGTRCSFQLMLNNGEPPPKEKQLVSFLFTYKDGTREKLFGGQVANKVRLFEFSPYYVYQVDCAAFDGRFLNVQPFDYQQLTPQPIEIHVAELFRLGGCTNPNNGSAWIRDRLQPVILQPAGPPAWITNAVDRDDQPFSVQNSLLGPALQKLCGQFGFTYRVDFGEWFDISNLGSNPLARVILTRNDYNLTREKLLIDTSPNADRCLQQKWSGLKTQFQARDTSRVVVAKDPESLLNANAPQLDTVNSYLIGVDDPAQSTNLLKKTGIVKQYFITTDEGGDGDDGGDDGF